MAAQTGNTYISATTTDSVEVLTANFDNEELDKSSQVIATTTDDPKWQDWVQNVHIAISGCRSTRGQLRARRGRKPQICRWNFDAICHNARDISISNVTIIDCNCIGLPIHCNYQLAHYTGFCRISRSILNRFQPNLQA